MRFDYSFKHRSDGLSPVLSVAIPHTIGEPLADSAASPSDIVISHDEGGVFRLGSELFREAAPSASLLKSPPFRPGTRNPRQTQS